METNYAKYTHTNSIFFSMHIFSASMHCIENLKRPYLDYGWCDSVQWITNWTENRLKTRVLFACGWMNAIALMYFLKWLNKLSIYLDRTITEFQIFFSVCCLISWTRKTPKYFHLYFHVLVIWLCYFHKIYAHFRQFNWGFATHKLHTY